MENYLSKITLVYFHTKLRKNVCYGIREIKCLRNCCTMKYKSMFVYRNVVAYYIVQIKSTTSRNNENHAYSFFAFWEPVPGYLYFLPVLPRRRGPTYWRTVVFVSAAKSGCSVTHLASMPSKFNFATAWRTSLQQRNSLALTSNSLLQRLQEHLMLKRVRNLTAKQIDQEVRKFNNKVGKLVYKIEEANEVT